MNPRCEVVATGKSVASWSAALVASGVLLSAGNGMAQNITMQDGGSTATINPGGGTGVAGMNTWSVASQNQLAQQWFWYSVGGSAPQSIDTIGGLTVSDNAYGGEGLNDVTLSYATSAMSVNVEYVLSGNGSSSGSADMMEYIWIDNTSANPLTLSFYQYSNFNLLNNNNNTINVTGSPGAYTGAIQTTGGPGGTGIAEVIDSPNAIRTEVANVYTTLGELNNPANTSFNLNDITSATGDVSWAFQWDAVIAPGGELDISKDKGLSIQTVPEPTTMAFIALGLGAFGMARRRQTA